MHRIFKELDVQLTHDDQKWLHRILMVMKMSLL